MFGKKKKAAGGTNGEHTPDHDGAEIEAAAATAASGKPVSKRQAKKLAKQNPPPKTLIATLTDPKTAKRVVLVAKIAGPAIAPFALKAATDTRGYLDERRARKLGVTAIEVGAYRGPTGSTEARLSGLARSIEELRDRRGGDLQVVRFAEVAKARIADLTTAVHASASMPGQRRRAILHAVARDMDQIDADLMTFLVGSGRS